MKNQFKVKNVKIATAPKMPFNILGQFNLVGYTISDGNRNGKDPLVVIRSWPLLTVDQKHEVERSIAYHFGPCGVLYEEWKLGD